MKNKIKVGILIRSFEILRWEYRIIEKLSSSEFAEIKFLIKLENGGENNHSDKYSVIYRLHEYLDRFFYRKGFDYHKKINILKSNMDIQSVPYDRIKETSEDSSGNEITGSEAKYRPDVILNLGFVPVENDLLTVPRYGIWYYNIGDVRIIRSWPPVYWEIVKKIPEIGATVNISGTDTKNDEVIYRTSISTFTRSININKDRIYGLASLIIPRLIKGLSESGSSYLDITIKRFNSNTEIISSGEYRSPNSINAFGNLARIFATNLYRNIVYTKKDFWYLLYKIIQSNKSFPAVIGSFSSLTAPKGKFWADPFVVTMDKHHYIFVEEYLFETRKAHISVLKLDDKGCLLSSERIIERPYHLSYPFIFSTNGRYYMVPESKENRTIQLFSCTGFPGKWEFVMNLMENVNAVDSTLLFYSNKWWLFTAIDELNNPSVPFSELFLFFSDDLFSGRWQSHPMNPVVTDVSHSRPAGRIFITDNKLYRPSQDCSGGYGRAFNLNQILKLNEETYEEIVVRKVEPDWDKRLIGTHTFNYDDNITVIDASPRRKRFRLSLFKN